MKRVADPENLNKIKLSAQGKVDTTGLEPKASPFDEYALEAALRLTENAANTKQRQGEVVVVTFGPKEAEQTLRAMLGTGRTGPSGSTRPTRRSMATSSRAA